MKTPLTLLITSVLLGSWLVAGQSAGPDQSSRAYTGVINLEGSDLGSIIAERRIRHSSQLYVGESQILVCDRSGEILAFDFSGRFSGAVGELPKPILRYVNSNMIAEAQPNFVSVGDQVYYSLGNRLTRLGSQPGRPNIEASTEFDRDIRLLQPIDDHMIVLGLSSHQLFSTVDASGTVLQSFGDLLVEPKNRKNMDANRFFAFFDQGRVLVLFQHYPLYRVYTPQGVLLTEGEYAVPSNMILTNPFPEQLITDESEVPWFQTIVLRAKYRNGLIYVLFGSFRFGVLGQNMKLLIEEDLWNDHPYRATPWPVDLDPTGERLLTFVYGKNGEISGLRWIPMIEAGNWR